MQETKDKKDILRILTDPWMYERIKDDLAPNLDVFKDQFTESTMISDARYIISDDKLALYIIHPLNSISWVIHTHVLPAAHTNSINYSKQVLDYIFTSYNDIHKLIAIIPDIYMDVLKHCKKCGFLQEGMISKSILKDGKILDQVMLGLERDRWVSSEN